MDTIQTSENDTIHIQECGAQPVEDTARSAEQILAEQKEQADHSNLFVP